jgi:hypothetical protein
MHTNQNPEATLLFKTRACLWASSQGDTRSSGGDVLPETVFRERILAHKKARLLNGKPGFEMEGSNNIAIELFAAGQQLKAT